MQAPNIEKSNISDAAQEFNANIESLNSKAWSAG
jgi:hypothetical protein